MYNKTQQPHKNADGHIHRSSFTSHIDIATWPPPIIRFCKRLGYNAKQACYVRYFGRLWFLWFFFIWQLREAVWFHLMSVKRRW